MKILLRLLRSKQWIKNGFILLPLVFSGKFIESYALQTCSWAVLGFSLITSAAYIVNDILDYKKDQLHPQKKDRPIAKGAISIKTAWLIFLACFLSGLSILYVVKFELVLLAFMYLALQAVYNLLTKKIVILDVMTVALGFQIRIWLGAIAVGVLPSHWLQMCALVLTLFLGFTKRRYEMDNLKEKAVEHRSALNDYKIYFLDQLIIISSTLTIVFYGLYTISDDVTARIGNNDLLYSICFVIYGMFRYFYLLHVKKVGDDPGEVLLKDIPLLYTILLWGAFIVGIILKSKGF